jgi:hypothetical protein
VVSRIGDLIRELTFWYKIDATGMPWMTFAQSPASEQTAACNTMFDDSLLCVIGTAGIKAAMLT